MFDSTTKVCVKVNDNNEITEINSSIFLVDVDGYIEIDEGEGDKYAHAQGNYLAKGLRDLNGRYNYKLIGNVVTEIPDEEKEAIEVNDSVNIPIEDRVVALEEALLEMIVGGIM